ncbi:MAG: hypothetical protein ACYC5A_02510 [Thermoleophilia bacterium]
MKQNNKYLAVALAAAVLTLMVSAGLALAEDNAATADTSGAFGVRAGQGPGGPGERGQMRDQMVGGEVVSVSDTAITLTAIRSGEEVTVAINGDTGYRSKDGEASLGDVVPGEHVGIRLTELRADGVEPVAETVMIGAPHRGDRPHPSVGEVTAVDGNTVTINTADGEQQYDLPEVIAGMRLGIAADEDGNVKAVMYDPPARPADAPEDAE